MFHIWQPATALLLNGDPGSAFLDWLMVWFFLPPTLEALGRRGAAKLLGTAWLAGVLVGFALAWPGIVLPGTPCLGLTALTTAMVVVFGLARPTAQILIFFVLPIRAIWIVWVELFLLGLYFLAYRNLESAVSLAACGTAWLWMWCDGSPSVALLKIRRRWLSRARPTSARGRFGVIQGGRADPPGGGWVH
jgi:membrane associated rhomboid family serine protease